MAVVKADAYGHGLERAALALQSADAFGVAALADGERIRDVGLTQPVILLSGFDAPEDLPRMQELNLTAVIHHESQLQMLEQASLTTPIQCWLKIDTGMHRLGFAPEHVHDVYARLKKLSTVANDITFISHFASSEEFAEDTIQPDDYRTRTQIETFRKAIEGLEGHRSLSNSAAILGWPQAHQNIVRAGGALYGMSLVTGKTGADFDLKPAMTFATRLVSTGVVKQGEPIGYSGTWIAPEDMPIGVAAAGYGDGYPRLVKPGTPVLVNGIRTQIIGRVSMDLTSIDLRPVRDASPGDPVLLWGEGLPIEHIAECAGTIAYELTCSITRRVRFIESI